MKNYSDGLFLLKLIKRRIQERNTIQGKVNLDTLDKFSQNALYWAITFQRIDDVKLLLKYGISQNIAPDLDAFSYAMTTENQALISLFQKEEEVALSA